MFDSDDVPQEPEHVEMSRKVATAVVDAIIGGAAENHPSADFIKRLVAQDKKGKEQAVDIVMEFGNTGELGLLNRRQAMKKGGGLAVAAVGLILASAASTELLMIAPRKPQSDVPESDMTPQERAQRRMQSFPVVKAAVVGGVVLAGVVGTIVYLHRQGKVKSEEFNSAVEQFAGKLDFKLHQLAAREQAPTRN